MLGPDVQSGTGSRRSRSASNVKKYTVIPPPLQTRRCSVRFLLWKPKTVPELRVAAASRGQGNGRFPRPWEGKRDCVPRRDRRNFLGRIPAAAGVAPLPAVGERRPCDSPDFGGRCVRPLGLYRRQAARRLADLAGAGEPGPHPPQSRLPPAPAGTGGCSALGRLLLPHQRAGRYRLGPDGDAALSGARPVSRNPPPVPHRQRRDGPASGARTQPQVLRLPDRADFRAADRSAFFAGRRVQHFRRDPDSGVLRGAPGAICVLQPGADRNASLQPGKRTLARAGQRAEGAAGPRAGGGQYTDLGLGRAQDQRSPGRHLVDHRVKTLAGGWVWSKGRGRVVERDAGDRPLRMTCVNGDIDDSKRAEVEALAAVQREKELSEMKSKFVSTASHEFRTPLATMLSSAELLEHYSESLSPAEKLNLLHTIQSGAKRMSELIDDVLTLGRAESGVLKLNLGRMDLSELCRKVASEFRIAHGQQHVISVDDRFDRADVHMDERLLRHILNNLLSNAVKYSPQGSEVSLSLSRRDEQAVIEVQDRGIGIPVQDQPRLFDSFHRASNVENRPGTGLGLSIVKKSVELHGGEISLASAPGAGTRFTVVLPLRPGERPVEAS